MMSRQNGIVLVVVLWALVLLLVIVSGVSSSVHTESTLAHHQLDQTRLRALADAAFHQGAARGHDPDLETAWKADGEPHEWRFDGVDMVIRLEKENLRLDLNQANAHQLKELLERLEVDPDRQSEIADAILDWRDKDSLHRLNGAEDKDYHDAGKPYGAKDSPFTSVDEIGLVLGIDPQLKMKMLPYLMLANPGNVGQTSALPGNFGASRGVGAAGRGLWVLVTIPTARQPFQAEALVRQSKDRFRLVRINYAVSSAPWPYYEEGE
jgi:general secretion pathway protein K